VDSLSRIDEITLLRTLICFNHIEAYQAFFR
jgi:hypothetical protein